MYNENYEDMEDFLVDEDFEDFDGSDFENEDYDDYEDYSKAARKAPRGVRGRNPRQSKKIYQGVSQLNISIVSTAATTQPIELFNSMRTIAETTNTAITSLTPFSPADRAAANLNGLIYFNAAGDLIFQLAAGTTVTISCREIPYRSLLKATMVSPFLIQKMRAVYSADAQIDEVLNYTSNSFMGKKQSDSINPRSFFDPTQFQALTVDIKQSYKIDRESGITYNALAGCNIRFTLFVSQFRKAAMRV